MRTHKKLEMFTSAAYMPLNDVDEDNKEEGEG